MKKKCLSILLMDVWCCCFITANENRICLKGMINSEFDLLQNFSANITKSRKYEIGTLLVITIKFPFACFVDV